MELQENKEVTDWTIDSMLEVALNEPDDFLKIKETLTRIGIASKRDRKLYQSSTTRTCPSSFLSLRCTNRSLKLLLYRNFVLSAIS